jgi:hypothetical protein
VVLRPNAGCGNGQQTHCNVLLRSPHAQRSWPVCRHHLLRPRFPNLFWCRTQTPQERSPNGRGATRRSLGLLLLIPTLIWCAVTTYRLHNAIPFDNSTPPEEVRYRNFRNEIIDVDGKSFEHCTFTNVKFRYSGRGPVQMMNNAFGGQNQVTSDNPALNSIVVLLKGTGIAASLPLFNRNGEPVVNVSPPLPAHQ